MYDFFLTTADTALTVRDMSKSTLTIRLPSELKKRLTEAAQADARSVGSYLVRVIEKHLGPAQPARSKKASS